MKIFKKGIVTLIFVMLVVLMAACSFKGNGGFFKPVSGLNSSSEKLSSKNSSSKNFFGESSSSNRSSSKNSSWGYTFSDDTSWEDSSSEDSSWVYSSSKDSSWVYSSSKDSSWVYSSSEDSSFEYSSSKDSSFEYSSSEESSWEDISSEDSSFEYSSSEDSSFEYSSSEESSWEDISSEDSSFEDSSSEQESESSSFEEDSSSEQESESSSPEEEDSSSTSAEYELIAPFNDPTSSTRLVKTKYKTDSAIVADAIATDFGADPTGERDSTSAIQEAINSVAQQGGGTVFLPVGKYLVSSTITIPSYVSLVGDWNQPIADNTDANFDYGTVILARPQAITLVTPQKRPLFNVSGCAGIVGLTFYYVEQDSTNIKTYGYTIYADSPSTATFKNLTFLNSTYGIGVSLNKSMNELVNLENIYGTFLFNAIRHNGTTDVGFYDNINISPKYWKNASAEYKCSSASSLDFFVSNNLTAIILGDLDDQLISNVNIESGKIGIKFTTGVRGEAGFWGLVHNANINCQQGVYADCLNAVSGVVFTHSKVGIVENNSPAGSIKMSNCTYESKGTGRVIQEAGNIASDAYMAPLSLEFSLSERLFVANNLTSGGNEDVTPILQELLNSVGEEGGIVVIPNGVYRIDAPVVVPKNVELRSTQSVFSRTNDHQSGKNGVVFITYVSGESFILKENAGIIGVRITHAKNDFLTAYDSLNNGSYSNDISIKADGAGAYAYRNESVGAYVGYDFSACDNHILKSNYGISYVNFIKAGGKNGTIVQCLSNPNFMTRSNLYEYFDASLAKIENWGRIRNSGEANDDFAILRDGIGRTFTKMVRLENAENQVALNVFCYGQAGLFDMYNVSATLVNTSLDYIPGSKFVYELSGGTCDIIGSLRVYGTSLKVNSGRLTAYGRIAFGEIKEKAYDSAVSLEDKIEYVSATATRKTLFDCNSTTTIFNVTFNFNPKYVVEGIGSWKWISNTFEGVFAPIDMSEFRLGYLHFYIYCSDITKMGDVGQIEITSSGVCDLNEYNWNVLQCITKTGWNEVWLDLFSAGTTGGAADLTSINYLRIYLLNSSANYYIDNIELVTD